MQLQISAHASLASFNGLNPAAVIDVSVVYIMSNNALTSMSPISLSGIQSLALSDNTVLPSIHSGFMAGVSATFTGGVCISFCI